MSNLTLADLKPLIFGALSALAFIIARAVVDHTQPYSLMGVWLYAPAVALIGVALAYWAFNMITIAQVALFQYQLKQRDVAPYDPVIDKELQELRLRALIHTVMSEDGYPISSFYDPRHDALVNALADEMLEYEAEFNAREEARLIAAITDMNQQDYQDQHEVNPAHWTQAALAQIIDMQPYFERQRLINKSG